ncbi:MAG: Rieske 2Fe-2S domain-containing protein [Sandaracinus sp.]|nr:Rieske 2Fe-2S domain-containing protein [Sandaracinus sp.]MCB9630726.1 Rieske 2Fe-2S domain-containing protein [Sandaracinus sp.]
MLVSLDRVLSRVRRGRGTPLPPEPDTEAARLAGYPGPFPSGWYALLRSSELRGRPVHVRALGVELVVFRGESGKVGVLDAHCPHLGANLAGGEVEGDCLKCPFHHWTFDACGDVAKIPYAERVPPRLRTRSWPVEERDGFVFVYYDVAHAQGRRDAEPPAPPYHLPTIDGLESGALVHRGDHDHGVVRMHLLEFCENSADSAHFEPLHGAMFLPWTDKKILGLRVHHDASWARDDSHPHITWFRNHAMIEAFGKRLPSTSADAAICIAGPGGVVTFHFDVPRAGRIVLYQTHTPEAPLRQRVRFRWYADRAMPRALVWYVVGNWISQWREDIAIWENKIHHRKPMLVREDGPILEMRKWYGRFYPSGRLHEKASPTDVVTR